VAPRLAAAPHRRRGSGYGRLTTSNAENNLVTYDSIEEFAALERAWNEVALKARTPFLTHEWARAWWHAFAAEDGIAVVLRGADGAFLAGAVLCRGSRGRLRAAANEYSEDWDLVAADDASRRSLLQGIASLRGTQLVLSAVPGASPSAQIAPETLREAGYRVAVTGEQRSPYLELPKAWEELLTTVSRNQRSKVRRYMGRLEREGKPVFRTTVSSDLEADLDRFLHVEASGWKGKAGTAILHDSRALELYTQFAYAAAARGWLRLHLLELDGVPIAGGYGCVLGNSAFLLKSGFDERYSKLAPGAVLRAETIRTAIEEGLNRYEFLGAADPHKLRWGAELQERLLVRGYRGTALPAYIYRHKLRPGARRLRDLVRKDRTAVTRAMIA
jgi:CelD/BcsL family acetyltransferase involved in cellulose biosynthesis